MKTPLQSICTVSRQDLWTTPGRSHCATVLLLVVTVALTQHVFGAERTRDTNGDKVDGAPVCLAPPAGLVVWLPGDGNTQDIRSNALELWVRGGVTFPAGKVAQTFSFDGTGDVTYSTINVGGAYTVDFWMRPTSSSGAQQLVSNSLADGQNFGELFYANGEIDYLQGGSFRIVSPGNAVPLNTYTHLALTYDGQVNRLYVNGNLTTTSEVHTGETFNNPIRVAYNIREALNRFTGQLDEIEIFNRALFQAEIQAIVNASSGGKCKSLVDADGDGVVNNRDACPGTSVGTAVNASGCPLGACFTPPPDMNNWFPGDGSAADLFNNAGPVFVNGGVTFPAGKVAQAFNFDGTGDVACQSVNAGAAYTVDFWLRPASSANQHLVSSRSNDPQQYGSLYYVNGEIDYLQGSVFRIVSPPPAVPLNTYTHLALSYDGQVNRLYLNGNLVATSLVHTGEVFNNPIRFGYDVAGTGNHFVGQLDEIEIFRRALSITEIRGIYHADNAGKCKTFVLASAASRKMHGSLGPFDVPLPLSGAPGVECRSSGGNHTLVFTFTSEVISGNASVTNGAGSVSGSPAFSANTMTVNLTGVADVQQVAVTLSNVNDPLFRTIPNTTVLMNLLSGDSTADKSVNSGDAIQTRNRSGQTADSANFRSDVNIDGTINSGDALIVRSRSGNGLP